MIKNYKITVNGTSYDVTVEEQDETRNDNLAPRVESVAASQPEISAQSHNKSEPAKVSSSDAVTAPMPGKVIKLNVTEGQKVEKGQLLLTLEAMKMENEIFAPKSGTVQIISAKQGANVSSGDVLLVIA